MQLKAVAVGPGKPDGSLADTGYFSEGDVKRCEANEMTPYIRQSGASQYSLGWAVQSATACL
jgi:hypothetical protein